jgi:hypothetical protein
LRRKYDNAAAPDDGEIYCNIVRYREIDDKDGVKQEFADWTRSKTRDFNQLQDRFELKDLKARLNRLRPFTGLWRDLKFGAFRQGMIQGCPEVCLNSILHSDY